MFFVFNISSGLNSIKAQTETDVYDILYRIFKKTPSENLKEKKSSIVLLPAFNYNPSEGFLVGVDLSRSTTQLIGTRSMMSTQSVYFSITTNGMLTAQIRHLTHFPNGKWKAVGGVEISRDMILDYGLGSGYGTREASNFYLYRTPNESPASSYPIVNGYIQIAEKIYYDLGKNLSVSSGLSFEIINKIVDEKLDSTHLTPHYKYSISKGFDPERYSMNGIQFHFRFDNAEHLNRCYGGMIAEIGLAFNQKFLGSTKNSTQLFSELRKYWSLSKRNPEHVIALWHWGSYRIGGDIPYLLLPGTGTDYSGRSGRGYTWGRFRGPAFFYGEIEYRFPILRNKFISGVVFSNIQTASDGEHIKLFEDWEPAVGAGLRILFSKRSRSNICVDYAEGKYGSSGLSFGLNETF